MASILYEAALYGSGGRRGDVFRDDNISVRYERETSAHDVKDRLRLDLREWISAVRSGAASEVRITEYMFQKALSTFCTFARAEM